MNKDDDLLKRIDVTINDTINYEKALKLNNGDIFIRNKNKPKNNSLLTNVFKEIINNDIKKKRV